MLLQISNADTLDSLSASSGQTSTLMFVYTIFGIVFLVCIIFFLTHKKITKVEQNQLSKHAGPKLIRQRKPKVVNNTVVKTTPQSLKEKPAKVTKTKKEITIPTKKEELADNKIEGKVAAVTIPIQSIEMVKSEKEEQSKEKYIGYNPINVFAQTDPLNFPYVIMPKQNCVIKFPRKGRVGRKGFKEDVFKIYILKYFGDDLQIFDDRFILVKNNSRPFEPDFALIDEKEGINIFLDIEIDEPYEGLNDLNKRRATHFQYLDTDRNNAFKNRGWIVIRFAEIQIHQEPEACCRFIADVIRSINPNFKVSSELNNSNQIKFIRQWTKYEAEVWSKEKYREQYLGITNFGSTDNNQILKVTETELGEKIEEQIIEDKKFVPPIISSNKTTNPKLDIINSAINTGKYLRFAYQETITITKPIKVTDINLTVFCYVKNNERIFNIQEISDLFVKDTYFTLRVAGPTIGLDKISNAVNTAITYRRYIRIKYTRASWTNMIVDPETGELLLNRIEAEESIRTINDVQLSINALSQEQINTYNLNRNHITAYCNKREEQRTFRFDRIGEIEILDL